MCLDGSGNSVPGVDGEGFAAIGVATATFDNRTGSEAGGSAGDLEAEIEFGVFGFNYSDSPVVGGILYVVDNQTVSSDSDSAQRGVAGVCVEVRGTQAYCLFAPQSGPLLAVLLAAIAAAAAA